MEKFVTSEKNRFELIVCPNYQQLSTEITKRILELSRIAIKNKGEFTIALSGGSTPKGLYLRMAEADFRNEFKWPSIHFFWGDEKWVPIADIRNNYRMVAEAFLAKCDVPVENIHPIKTKEASPEVSANLYEADLISHFKLKKGEFPKFDLILLGLGQDGHVASLFPGNPALEEKKRLAVSVKAEEVEEPRVTLTFPVINHAQNIIFMVSGKEKATILNTVLGNGKHIEGMSSPAEWVQPDKGTLAWYADKSAMSILESKMPA